MSAGKCIKEILLSEYLDGELRADAEKNIRGHLSCCRECNAAYQRLKADRSLLLECLPGPNPPSHLRQQLLGKINAASESAGRLGIMNRMGLGLCFPAASRAWAAAATCVVFAAVAMSAFHIHSYFDNKRVLAEMDRSVAQWAARDFSLNPFDIDIQGAPLEVTKENPFNSYLNER